MDCLFCKIIEGTIPSTKVYEDEYCYSFLDINPQAPVHALVIPKLHIESCDKVDAGCSEHIKKIFEAIPKIAEILGLAGGYRVISNVGTDGAQSVKHLHFHILGGKQLTESLV